MIFCKLLSSVHAPIFKTILLKFMIDGIIKLYSIIQFANSLLTDNESSVFAHKLKGLMKRLQELVVSRGRSDLSINSLIPQFRMK